MGKLVAGGRWPLVVRAGGRAWPSVLAVAAGLRLGRLQRPAPPSRRRPDPAGVQPGAGHPAGLADPLPAGGRHLSRAALVGAGRHRHRRVRQRPVDRPRRLVRGQRAGAEGPDAVRAGHLRRLRHRRARRGPAAVALRPGRRRLHGGRPAVRRRRRHPPPPCGPPSPTTTTPTAYVDTVLTLALAFGDDPATSGTVVAALSFAAQQLGTPYVWGGTGAGASTARAWPRPPTATPGSPCPGWPRTSSTPGRPVPAGSTVAPGDLVFFGTGPSGSTTSASTSAPAR